MVEDISRKSISMLVLLTVLLSIVGTLTVIEQITVVESASTRAGPQTGNVNIEILSPNTPVSPDVQGDVSIIITPAS